jgi:hypothetical protein
MLHMRNLSRESTHSIVNDLPIEDKRKKEFCKVYENTQSKSTLIIRKRVQSCLRIAYNRDHSTHGQYSK